MCSPCHYPLNTCLHCICIVFSIMNNGKLCKEKCVGSNTTIAFSIRDSGIRRPGGLRNNPHTHTLIPTENCICNLANGNSYYCSYLDSSGSSSFPRKQLQYLCILNFTEIQSRKAKIKCKRGNKTWGRCVHVYTQVASSRLFLIHTLLLLVSLPGGRGCLEGITQNNALQWAVKTVNVSKKQGSLLSL